MKVVPEWSRQEALWLCWPHNERSWGRLRPEIETFYVDIIRKTLEFQMVKLIVPADEPLKDEIISRIERARGGERKRRFALETFAFSTNDVWIRDYCPFFVEDSEGRLLVNFQFNAWGEQFPPWDCDNNFSKRLAAELRMRIVQVGMVIEGGSVDINGDGLLIAASGPLLGERRNPQMSLEQIKGALAGQLGVSHVILLGQGLCGDHTGGHIDNIVRFAGCDTLLVARPHIDDKINRLRYAWNMDSMDRQFRENGISGIRKIELPLPNIRDGYGNRLTASYINFVFINNAVLLPQFGCVHDKEAMDVFKAVFPDREMVPVNSLAPIIEGGGLHCLTMNEPVEGSP